eukprot:scaffold11750_cov135-Isochrysis_galbana.AAC.2
MCAFLGRVAEWRVEAEPHASNAGAWLARVSSACFHESTRLITGALWLSGGAAQGSPATSASQGRRQTQPQRAANRGKPQLGRWALYWEGVFGAAQNVGRFWCRHPARLLWASGGHPRGQSRLIWVRPGPWVPYVEQAGRPTPE